MNVFYSILFSVVLGTLMIRWMQQLRVKYKRHHQIIHNNCKPARTLPRNLWWLGLDVVNEMFRSYSSGTRNRTLQNQFKTIGSTFRTEPSGTARIFTIDPANLKATFGGKIDDWGVEPIRLDAFRPLVGRGVLVIDGSPWTHARSLCEPVIDHIQRLHDRDLSCFDDDIRSLIQLIPIDGSTVDLKPLFTQYMIDSGTEYIFGKSVGSLKQGAEGMEGKEFLEAFLYGIDSSGKRDELPQWTYLATDRKFRKACKTVHRITDRYVQAAMKQCHAPPDSNILSTASLAREWAKLTSDPEEIRNQILNVLVAGFDTIAITLTNAFFHLARSPACYQQLHAEAVNYTGPLTGQGMKSLRCLQAVLNETLRLNTPASFNSRVALRDTTIPKGGGADGNAAVFVPKGDIVVSSIYALQRRIEVFGDDADEFRATRWENIKPKHWEYMPFSAGPRVCPGQKLALAQAAYVIFSLARHFRALENRDPVWEFVEEYKVSTASKNGAKVALIS